MPKLPSIAVRRQRLLPILEKLKEENPNPRCELSYTTGFQLLVSVVLSAQATDKQVNKVMEPLYQAGFSLDTVLQWGEQGLLERIRSIGLAPTKAKNIFRLAQTLRNDYWDEIPASREALEALPGVGRKTANVILGELFRQPTLAVDTHVFRVGQRLGLHQESRPEKAEAVLLQLIPASSLPDAHHWFILLGRYTCKARKPACERCVVRENCPSQGSV